jgi:membrane protease YdiL (CAAX protease family)
VEQAGPVPLAVAPAQLPPVGYAVETALVAWLALVVPVLGRARYRLLTTGGLDRVAFYRRVVVRQVTMTLAVVAALVLSGVPLDALGLRWRSGATSSLASAAVPVAVAAVAVAVVLRAQAALRPARPLVARLLRPVAALLPTTTAERWHFAGVAVSAGVGEEVLYRGVVVSWLIGTAPTLHRPELALASAAVFGLGHLYQGWAGALATAGAGYVFAAMYFATGSLLAPAVVHVLVDLRVLLLVPARAAPAPALTSTFPLSAAVDGPPPGPAASTSYGPLSSP